MFLPADDDDLPAIVALMNRAYRGNIGWTTENAYLAGDRTTEALLRAELTAKPSAILLKWEDAHSDDIGGCVWLEPLEADVWYMGSLTIDPARQNQGLGRKLLAAAENWARPRGAERMRMTVINIRETLIAWYQRRGYALTGATEPFPYDDARFGKPLRDDLSFVVLEKAL